MTETRRTVPYRANPTLVLLTAILAVAVAGFSGTSHAVSVTYDWSTATSSASGVLLSGNDNWVFVGGEGDGTGDAVRSSGQPDSNFTGNYYQSVLDGSPGGSGTGDSIYYRTNDGSFSYSIPSNATTISFSYITRHSGETASVSDIGRAGLLSGGTRVMTITNGAVGWGFRDVGDANNAGANGTTANTMLNGTNNTWRLTGTLDMTVPGTEKTFDLLVENLSLGGSELIHDDVPYELGAFADPSTWDGMLIRVNGISDPAYIDAMTISYTTAVPLPAAAWLFGAGLLGLAGLARSRRET